MINKMKGIFFDLDGTLVDSNLNFSKIKEEIGISHDQMILEYIEKLTDKKEIERAREIVHRHELIGAESSTLLPGVKEFLEELNSLNIYTSIITRNSKAVAELTVKKHDLNFSYVISRDDFPPKPDPSSLNFLLNEFKLTPDISCYIGDYIFDLQTAKNAHVKAGLFINEKNQQFIEHSDFSFSCYFNLREQLLAL